MYRPNRKSISNHGAHTRKSILGALLIMLVSVLVLPLSRIRPKEPEKIIVRALNVNRAVADTTQTAKPHKPVRSRQIPFPVTPVMPDLDSAPVPIELDPVDLNIETTMELLKPELTSLKTPELHLPNVENVDIFEVNELDFMPSLLRKPIFQFPKSLLRQGVRSGSVKVAIRVDRRGRVMILEVLKSSHPELITPACNAIEQAVYQRPMKDGRAVFMYYIWELNLKEELDF